MFHLQESDDHPVQGRPEAFKAPWSHADEVTIMGAFGGFARGWENVAQRLDWARAGIGGSERRVENDSWKVVVRHADELPEKDPPQSWRASPGDRSGAIGPRHGRQDARLPPERASASATNKASGRARPAAACH
jgi:hypothetical protein